MQEKHTLQKKKQQQGTEQNREFKYKTNQITER